MARRADVVRAHEGRAGGALTARKWARLALAILLSWAMAVGSAPTLAFAEPADNADADPQPTAAGNTFVVNGVGATPEDESTIIANLEAMANVELSDEELAALSGGQDESIAPEEEVLLDEELTYVGWETVLEREASAGPDGAAGEDGGTGESANADGLAADGAAGDSVGLDVASSGGGEDAGAAELDVQASYTYKVRPLLAPFNNIIFVETNNPDPKSFRLVDKSSKYLAEAGGASNPGAFVVMDHNFVDVKYENAATYRVKGGYLFYDYDCLSDGGALTLQLKDASGSFKDTKTQVSCAAMKDRYDYLIDTYAKGQSGFFDKMDAVQGALDKIAIYPLPVKDSSKPNKERPYPFLAASPYPELPLNEHYEMFEDSEKGLLLKAVYPFVLHSLTFPGTMRVVAQRLSSEATVSSGYTHAYVTVTYKGEERMYGGAGNHAGSDIPPIYTKNIDWAYSFDGGKSDWAHTHNLQSMYDKLYGLGEKGWQDIAAYRKMLSEPEMRKVVGSGGWIRVAAEGSFGYGATFAYAIAGPDDGVWIASNAWVDGRYVDENEELMNSASFSDHPKADIVVQNVAYTDKKGKGHTNDVRYIYDEKTDTWRAGFYYAGGYSYSSYDDEALPPELVLTRSEVEAIKPDGKPFTPPLSGYIYDGTVKPGTPFTTKRVKSVSLPKTVTVEVGHGTTLTATISPANADVTGVIWSSSDERVAKVSGDYVTGVSEGKATLTVKTMDGAHTATCEVTVTKESAPEPSPTPAPEPEQTPQPSNPTPGNPTPGDSTPSNPQPSDPAPQPQPAATTEMHRLYNPYTGEHFYTADAGERDGLAAIGWAYEGVGWTAPRDGEPVFRLYNPFAGDHHYTTSAGERDALVAAGWVDEGVGWRSAGEGGVPLYRQYNPYAQVGTHNYTTSLEENGMLVSVGWVEEGVGWYGVA